MGVVVTGAGIALKVFNILHVQLAGPGLVVRVDVCHQRVPGTIDPFTDNASVFLLPFSVLVSNVPFERRLRT